MLKKIFTSLTSAAVGFTPLIANAHSGCTTASFYGTPEDGYGYISGRMITASGERFNPQAMTTAHRTLPFGTRLRVTNSQTGRSVIVRVNDRGPFVRGRDLDLSFGAFRAIASPSQGLTHVCYSRV